MPKKKKETAAQACVEVLKQTGNPSFCWGDFGIAHAIVERLGWKHRSYKTCTYIMDAIDRTNRGELEKFYVQIGRTRGRVFRPVAKNPSDPTTTLLDNSITGR